MDQRASLLAPAISTIKKNDRNPVLGYKVFFICCCFGKKVKAQLNKPRR